MALDPKICANPVCGQEFTPARRDARYCNSSCRAQASRLRSGTEDAPRRPVALDAAGVVALFGPALAASVAPQAGWPTRTLVLLRDGREKRSLTRTVPSPVPA